MHVLPQKDVRTTQKTRLTLSLNPKITNVRLASCDF